MYNRLKELLLYIKTCHEYPGWFNSEENSSVVTELKENGVIYPSTAKVTPCKANYYDKTVDFQKEILCVNERLAKQIYDIDLSMRNR